MKYLFIIFFISCAAIKPVVDFVASSGRSAVANDTVHFATGNESVVSKYLIEFGTDTSNYTTIGKFMPGSSNYTLAIPQQQGFVRIHAVGPVDFFTGPIFRELIANVVTISNISHSSTTLKWSVSNENNVSLYIIERSNDGKNWSKITQITDRGNGNYSYRYSRSSKKYNFRITPVYRDGTKGITISFK